VPDVAGNASSASPYQVIVNGTSLLLGGTSAVAPLWAGLVARINQNATPHIGFFLPTLYANAHVLYDIIRGDNKPVATNLGYSAGPGWDACTGLGVPDGEAIADLFTTLGETPVTISSVPDGTRVELSGTIVQFLAREAIHVARTFGQSGPLAGATSVLWRVENYGPGSVWVASGTIEIRPRQVWVTLQGNYVSVEWLAYKETNPATVLITANIVS
jgi:hypothetical protein